MTTRRYPTKGRKQFLPVLDSQDYVEEEGFCGDNLGYFCSTCIHFMQTKEDEEDMDVGTCRLLDNAPVRTFGCCNAWKISDEEPLLTSDGYAEE